MKDKFQGQFPIAHSQLNAFSERHGGSWEICGFSPNFATVNVRLEKSAPFGDHSLPVARRVPVVVFTSHDGIRVKVGGASPAARSKSWPDVKLFEVLVRRYAAFGQVRVTPTLKRDCVVEESKNRGHDNACAVVALSRAAQCSFEDADAFWKLYEARDSDRTGTRSLFGLMKADPEGCHTGVFKLDLLGVKFIDEGRYRGMTLAGLQKLPEVQQGRYFVGVLGHALAMVNGRYIETAKSGARKRINRCYRVEQL